MGLYRAVVTTKRVYLLDQRRGDTLHHVFEFRLGSTKPVAEYHIGGTMYTGVMNPGPETRALNIPTTPLLALSVAFTVYAKQRGLLTGDDGVADGGMLLSALYCLLAGRSPSGCAAATRSRGGGRSRGGCWRLSSVRGAGGDVDAARVAVEEGTRTRERVTSCPLKPSNRFRLAMRLSNPPFIIRYEPQ